MKEQLLALENVIGVGRGKKNLTGPLSTVVLVEKKIPIAALEYSQRIPKRFEGQVTDVLEVGRIVAQETNHLRVDRWRPAPGGVSIGHFKITAGTLGVATR